MALHIPLGKLHSERLVPADEEVQHIVARIVELRALTRRIPAHETQAFLLPRYRQPGTWYSALYDTLAEIARAAGCTSRVHPHRLRHSFATEMVRLGVRLSFIFLGVPRSGRCGLFEATNMKVRKCGLCLVATWQVVAACPILSFANQLRVGILMRRA